MDRPIFVSACLLGIPCRYNGNGKPIPQMVKLLNRDRIMIPFCPETQGGLDIPRPPAEIVNGDGRMVLEGKAKVINQEGEDCTEPFINGAKAVLQMATVLKPRLIVLKSNSPSCGLGRIYDGSFSGRLKPGNGVTAALLDEAHFELCTETELLTRIRQMTGTVDDTDYADTTEN